MCVDDVYLDERSIDVRMSEYAAQAHAIAIVYSEERHSCTIVERRVLTRHYLRMTILVDVIGQMSVAFRYILHG